MKKLSLYIQYAWSETKGSRGKLFFCVFSIALGVFIVTSVRTIISSLEGEIQSHSRSLMGADLMLEASKPLSEQMSSQLKTAVTELAKNQSESIQFHSMLRVLQPDQSASAKQKNLRLVQVRAIDNAFPFYGQIESEPVGQWQSLQDNKDVILIDYNLKNQLGLKIDQQVALGEKKYRIAGFIIKSAGSPISTFSWAPAVYVHISSVNATNLLQKGSRVRYQRFIKTPLDFDVQKWQSRNSVEASSNHIRIRSYHESAGNVRRFISRFATFVTLVGLITLLLSGLGIGSAMNVFIKSKIKHAAILRSLGLTPHQVVGLFFILALILSLLGTLLGVLPGTLLPIAAGSLIPESATMQYLPVNIEINFSWQAIFQGSLAGILASLIFTLWPILRLSRLSPMLVLRGSDHYEQHEVNLTKPDGNAAISTISTKSTMAASLWDLQRRLLARGVISRHRLLILLIILILCCLSLSAFISLVQSVSWQITLYFSLAIAVVLILLSFFSKLITKITLPISRRIRQFHIRQGLANLHRPGNQTRTVIVTSAIGIILIITVFILEDSLQKEISLDDKPDRPNHFMIDIQVSQRQEVEKMLLDLKAKNINLAPMIIARIRSVNNQAFDNPELSPNDVDRSWESRLRNREYYITYREKLLDSEQVVSGKFWHNKSEVQEASVDDQWAKRLGIDLGDSLSFDIQGIPLNAVVTSTRKIRWQEMMPNSYIVLSPGKIANAPQIYIGSFFVPDRSSSSSIQQALSEKFANLSIIDISDEIKNVRFIIDRISYIIKFLAGITIINSIIILLGAISAGRFSRLQEAMLLKVIGASRWDINGILLSEYFFLSFLGVISGILLALAINIPLIGQLININVHIPWLPIAAISMTIIAINVIMGFYISRDVSKSIPLDILRAQ